MVLSFIRRKRGEVIQAEHVNELQIAAEQLDAGKAEQTDLESLETEVAAKLNIADVLNEPDMATGAIDKPPSQASVVEYLAALLATKADAPVTPAATTFVTTGINLADPDLYEAGVLNSSGTLNASVEYHTTGFIPVTGGQAYTFSASGAFAGPRWIAVYDADGSLVDYIDNSGNPTATVTPASDGYVRASYRNEVLETIQIEAGSIATDYEPYALLIPELRVDEDNLGPSVMALIEAAIGAALPTGGIPGQVLVKDGTTDYAAAWVTPVGVVEPMLLLPFESDLAGYDRTGRVDADGATAAPLVEVS